MPEDTEDLVWCDKVRYMIEMCHQLLRVKEESTTQEDLLTDKFGMVNSGSIYSIAMIGEYTKYIPKDVRKEYPEIDWSNIMGMRHILVHEPENVDNDIIWDIIQTKISELLAVLMKILQEAEK